MAIVVTLFELGNNPSSGVSTVALTNVAGIPAGALIFACVCEFASTGTGTGGSVTDDASNTYTQGTGKLLNNTGHHFINYWYTANCAAVTDTITYHLADTTNGISAISTCYATGIAASSPLDTAVTASLTGTGSANPLFTLTSGTPGESGELFIAFSGQQNGVGGGQSWLGSATGWSGPPGTSSVSGSAYVKGANQINAGTGTKSFAPANASSTASAYAAMILGFKAAPDLPAPQQFRFM